MFTESLEGLQFQLSPKLMGPNDSSKLYTVDSIEDGVATIVWETEEGIDDVTYPVQEVIKFVKNKNWVIVDTNDIKKANVHSINS